MSICIPAYNRAALLEPLLDSILHQDFLDYEVVICEDGSPQRDAIRRTVEDYAASFGERLRYHENARNLGYDGNLRELVRRASGDYCLFMGNDDLLAPGGLAAVAGAAGRHPDVGVVLRGYAAFSGAPDNVTQTYRYLDRETFFPKGAAAMVFFFRRSVVISGMTVRREDALRHATDRFDGTLLYQLHLAGRILAESNGVAVPDVVALYRTGGVPDFGTSEAERGKFTPQRQTPASSVGFVRGQLAIARALEEDTGLPVYKAILRDVANYSYPLFSIQGRLSFRDYAHYVGELGRLGLSRHPLFFAYAAATKLLGVRAMDALVGAVKRRLGRAPLLGVKEAPR